MVRITFDTTNSEGLNPSTADPDNAARLLEKIAAAIREGYRSARLFDDYGNLIGGWTATFEE